jgi:hypothetical protein
MERPEAPSPLEKGGHELGEDGMGGGDRPKHSQSPPYQGGFRGIGLRWKTEGRSPLGKPIVMLKYTSSPLLKTYTQCSLTQNSIRPGNR